MDNNLILWPKSITVIKISDDTEIYHYSDLDKYSLISSLFDRTENNYNYSNRYDIFLFLDNKSIFTY